MKRFVLIFAGILAFARLPGYCLTPQPTTLPPSVSVSSVSTAAGQASITITTPTSVGPYSSGQYTYISHIHVEMYATGTLTGGATPVTCTTTNLQSLALKFPTAAATGTVSVVDMALDNALQGTQGSNVTITCPATASVIWNVVLTYFQGS